MADGGLRKVAGYPPSIANAFSLIRWYFFGIGAWESVPIGAMVNQDNGQKYVIAIDQGTTGTAALVVNHDGRVVGWADREIS